MTQIFDIGIIGAGIAGAFAAYKISKNNKNLKTLVIESGRPARKRRTQMQGFIGLLPNSDGKLFINDLNLVSDLTSVKKTKDSYNWIKNEISDVINFNIIKDTSPQKSIENKIKKSGFKIKLQNHIQLVPHEIHNLSKFISDTINSNKNIYSLFDTEVLKIFKEKNGFIISTELEEYKCKKILLSVGRSGWRWISELYSNFGIIENNDYSNFGIRIEVSDVSLKDFNNTNCTISKNDLDIGPFGWSGTIIPEDHFDMAISSFRSNESRWKSDKVSFNLISKRYFKNQGFEQTDRIGQLTFILTNDRVIKEKLSTFLSGKSKISIMPEYNWLHDSIKEIAKFIPDIINKGYFHVPTLIPMGPKINIGNNLITEVDGMYVAGESAGICGILAAMVSGTIAGDSLCK